MIFCLYVFQQVSARGFYLENERFGIPALQMAYGSPLKFAPKGQGPHFVAINPGACKKSYGLVRKLDLPPEQPETWESPTDHNAIAKPTVVGNDVDHHAVREEASRDVCGRHIGAAHLIRHPSYGVGLDPLQELLRGDATHVKDLAVGPHSRGHRSRRWGALECCAIRRRTLSLISWDVELFHGKSWTPCRTYLYTG